MKGLNYLSSILYGHNSSRLAMLRGLLTSIRRRVQENCGVQSNLGRRVALAKTKKDACFWHIHSWDWAPSVVEPKVFGLTKPRCRTDQIVCIGRNERTYYAEENKWGQVVVLFLVYIHVPLLVFPGPRENIYAISNRLSNQLGWKGRFVFRSCHAHSQALQSVAVRFLVLVLWRCEATNQSFRPKKKKMGLSFLKCQISAADRYIRKGGKENY